MNLVLLSEVLVIAARDLQVFTSKSLLEAVYLPPHMRRRVAEVIMVWEGSGLVKRLTKGYNAQFKWL